MSKLYEIKVKNQSGEEVSLETFKGKVLLVVNTATKCGFTPQYTALEALFEKYEDKGFVILDFPCNQFFKQAPGSDAEIHSFCSLNYNTKFPQFSKIEVNGKNEHPLYAFLKSQKPGRIPWNFTKFLVDKEGRVVARFAPTVKPEEIEPEILKLL